jgi:hypothetical protein
LSKEIKADGWVARDEGCGGRVCFRIDEPTREASFWGADMSTPLKDIERFEYLTRQDDPIPVSIVPTAELEAMREVVEAAKTTVKAINELHYQGGEVNEVLVSGIQLDQALAKED